MARGKQTLRKKPSPRVYDDVGKRSDPLKKQANLVVCDAVRDLQRFFGGLWDADEVRNRVRDMRYLALDGADMETHKHLVAECGVAPVNIYLCSREERFTTRCRRKYNTHHGELVDFISRLDPTEELFDAVYLDFCGHLRKDNLRALQLLFERDLLEPLAVLAITVSYCRNKHRHQYYQQLICEAEDTVRDTAHAHGYRLGWVKCIRNAKYGMVTFVWKCMHAARALDFDTGYGAWRNGYGANDWLRDELK